MVGGAVTRRPSSNHAGNQVSGTVVGPSVQALDIHGGVHFHGVGQPSVIVPHQVPPPVSHFTGRRSELAMISQAVTGTGSVVVVLSGPGGVGKSALARQWAHESAAAFPHGRLHLSLGGFDAGSPVDPVPALRSLLRALDVPAGGLPESLAELVALYRSHTAGRSLLVVLDDAYSAAQVRVLLPASTSSMTVVTSRSRLSGLIADGAVVVEVDPMPAEDSLALLTNVLGRAKVDGERAQAVRLAELCAGLPIALSLVAARLSTRPRLTIGGVVAGLATETDRLAGLATPEEEVSVGGTFELSYRALGAPAAALYRRLSLHPGREFGAGPVAGLMPRIRAETISTVQAGRLVDLLLEVNLLQEVAEQRFRFHDLIHLHARQKAMADDAEATRDDALLAMVEWYLGAASAADAVITPYRRRLTYDYRTSPDLLPVFGDRDAGLAWLDGERGNLGAAGQAALDHGWAELAWHLSDVLWPLQLYRKSTDRREIDVRGLAAAQMWGDARAEARMLKRLGRTCTTVGEHDRAEHLLRTAVRRCTEVGDVEGGVEAEEMLALAYRDSGREIAAMDLLHQVLITRRRLGDGRNIGLTLINMGELSSRRGLVAEAIELLREAGHLLAESANADPYNPVRVSLGLARAFLDGGDLDAADRAASRAVSGMRGLGAALGEADALEVAGRVAELRGEADLGRRFRQQALEILETHGSPRADALRQQLAAPPGVQEAR
jgi:tetratricopeptide (TPR) repeat protein